MERTGTLILPTQGRARVLSLRPRVVSVRSVSDEAVVLEALRVGACLVHLWDRTGRRDIRVEVTERASLLRQERARRRRALEHRLGLPQRTLKLDYRTELEHQERSPNASVSDLDEQIRIQTHHLKTRAGLGPGELLGDFYLESRRDLSIGKEVTQPRNLSLRWEGVPLGVLGKTDWVLGDRDLTFSPFTLRADRYRGVGLFPADPTPENPFDNRPLADGRPLALSLFGGEEREGFSLDFPAGFQTPNPRSRIAAARLDFAVLPDLAAHFTGLHRGGRNSESVGRADHVYEFGLDGRWKKLAQMQGLIARNGATGAYEVEAELTPWPWFRLESDLWNVGERYKTVSGSVARSGETGWTGRLSMTPPLWGEALTLTGRSTLYRDRDSRNPANPDEINTEYAMGLQADLPWQTRLRTRYTYRDESGLALPSVDQRFDLRLSRSFNVEETPWLDNLLYETGWIRSIHPFVELQHEDHAKSNDIPGSDATLKLIRVGTRLQFPRGFWGSVSWAQGELKEADPEIGPKTIQPKEWVLEAGGGYRFERIPLSLTGRLRLTDVEDTFSKTHQPFSDRNRLTGDLRFSWRLAQNREIFGSLTATRQKPETQRSETLVDVIARVGMRFLWDTGWAPGQTGSIAGSVFEDANFNGKRDPSEPGLAGVPVLLEGGPSTRTDAQGRFSFRGIQEGIHRLRVETGDLPAGFSFTTSNALEAVVFPREETKLAFGAATEVWFEGWAFNDLNGSGAFEKELDLPVQNVRLNLESGQGAWTDARGHYLIRRAPPGSHTLSADITTLPSGYQTLAPIRKSWQTRAGDRVRYDLPLKALRSLSGRVYLDENGNGQQDDGERGVEGVRIVFGDRTAVTGPEGAYRLESIPPGRGILAPRPETLPAGFSLRPPAPPPIEVPKGPFQRRISLPLVPEGWRPPAPSDEAGPPEKPARPLPEPRREQRAGELREKLRKTLAALAPPETGWTPQVIDSELVNLFPELAALPDLHPGLLIDASENEAQTLDLVTELIARSAVRVDYHAHSPRADRFLKFAEAGLIEVRVVRLPEERGDPLRGILTRLSPHPLVKTDRITDWVLLRRRLRELLRLR